KKEDCSKNRSYIMFYLRRDSMTYRKQLFVFIAICLLCIGLQTIQQPKQVKAFSPQVIQHGAVGDDVIELQARLQYIGFYNGKIDGVFGWGTYWALRNFQYEFGMEVDGVAGASTKQKLVDATKYDEAYVKEQINQGKRFTHYGGGGGSGGKQATEASANVPQGYSQNDINLMANAVYGEARGEPYEGQVAVAAVILNR